MTPFTLQRPWQCCCSLTLFVFLLASCGSYQSASYYDDDGIYAQDKRKTHVEKKVSKAPENNTYEAYFGQKANEYGEILEDEIFTDVDAYSSSVENDSVPIGEQTDYVVYNNTYTGNPGWGDNPTHVTVNVYDNWGWGSPFWGVGYGWGWYRPWGWNRWGWRHPYWGFGYGWGSYHGYPGYRPHYRGYYGRNYSYNRTRRGYPNAVVPRTALRTRSNTTLRNRAYISRYGTRRSSAPSSTAARRRSVRADDAARNQGYRNRRSTQATPNTSGTGNRNASYKRTTSPSTRKYQSSRSSNYGRSSGNYRSSGSYGRTSGASRSSSRSGGRRN